MPRRAVTQVRVFAQTRCTTVSTHRRAAARVVPVMGVINVFGVPAGLHRIQAVPHVAE